MSYPGPMMAVVSPHPRERRSGRLPAQRAARPSPVRTGPSSDDVHDVVFFRRHRDDDPTGTMPGREALDSYPPSVRAKMRAVLVAVAAAPPKRFSGGGYWEAMKGAMSGWYEVRVDGPGRHHYRLFCLLDYTAPDRDKPLLVIIDGRDKPFRTRLTDADYARIRRLGDEYLGRTPRSLG